MDNFIVSEVSTNRCNVLQDCFFDRRSYTGWLEWYCRGRRANCADIDTQWKNSRTNNRFVLY